MCFMKMPKPEKPPSPPSVSKLNTDNLADRQRKAASAGGTILTSTNITKGMAGAPPVFNPSATSGMSGN